MKNCRVEGRGDLETLSKYIGWKIIDVRRTLVDGYRIIYLANDKGECVRIELDYPELFQCDEG